MFQLTSYTTSFFIFRKKSKSHLESDQRDVALGILVSANVDQPCRQQDCALAFVSLVGPELHL